MRSVVYVIPLEKNYNNKNACFACGNGIEIIYDTFFIHFY